MYDGKLWRHVRHGRDPLSGTGARIQGGRWNPPDSFSVLYLAADPATVIAEFQRLAGRQGIDPSAFLPRAMYSYDVNLSALLDLTRPESRGAVGLPESDLRSDDLTACQAVGEAAYVCRRSGVIAPSATGVGVVVAVFPDCLAPEDQLTAGDYELWERSTTIHSRTSDGASRGREDYSSGREGAPRQTSAPRFRGRSAAARGR